SQPFSQIIRPTRRDEVSESSGAQSSRNHCEAECRMHSPGLPECSAIADAWVCRTRRSSEVKVFRRCRSTHRSISYVCYTSIWDVLTLRVAMAPFLREGAPG